VAEIGRKLSKALGFLLDARIYHRDLRPQNVILSGENFDPIIIDFGFARRIGAGGKTPLIDPLFVAPEAQRDDPDWTAAADVYGLGATLRSVLAPGRTDNSLSKLLDKCCNVCPSERPHPAELYDSFQQVARELHVETENDKIWTQICELSRGDCIGNRQFKEILKKFQRMFETLKLGYCTSQSERASKVADFLNQTVEALSNGRLTLSRGKDYQEKILPQELRTDELAFVRDCRNFEVHGGRQAAPATNKSAAEVRELVLTGAAQIARYFSVPSLTRVIEAVI
jgi:serine/threonine protein kinase